MNVESKKNVEIQISKIGMRMLMMLIGPTAIKNIGNNVVFLQQRLTNRRN